MQLEPYFILGYVAALIMLSITSYMDLRTREIDPRVWIPFAAAAVIIIVVRILSSWDQFFMIYLLFSMIPPAILLAMGLLGMMGLADPIALAIVSLLIPKPPTGLVLPPSIVILALASILMLFILVIPIFIMNIPRLSLISRYCGSRHSAILIALTGFPISIKRFLGSKFLYPLVYPSLGEGKMIWVCRGSFEIEEDPRIHREAIAMLLEKGYVGGEETMYVTWGVPYIVFILLGLLLYPPAAGWVEGFFRDIYMWLHSWLSL